MHECVIGVFHHTDYSELVTLLDLEEYIFEAEQYNRNLPKHSEWRKKLVWSLQDYANRRKKTNLRRFTYCPECGEKIDWKSIRRYGDG